ncbi:hypothetical protein KW786_01490 [Candidatus Parcubacteria bacterium]|nr:hypothetical protein [Candidatus Parcubacteria bacterium]
MAEQLHHDTDDEPSEKKVARGKVPVFVGRKFGELDQADKDLLSDNGVSATDWNSRKPAKRRELLNDLGLIAEEEKEEQKKPDNEKKKEGEGEDFKVSLDEPEDVDEEIRGIKEHTEREQRILERLDASQAALAELDFEVSEDLTDWRNDLISRIDRFRERFTSGESELSGRDLSAIGREVGILEQEIVSLTRKIDKLKKAKDKEKTKKKGGWFSRLFSKKEEEVEKSQEELRAEADEELLLDSIKKNKKVDCPKCKYRFVLDYSMMTGSQMCPSCEAGVPYQKALNEIDKGDREVPPIKNAKREAEDWLDEPKGKASKKGGARGSKPASSRRKSSKAKAEAPADSSPAPRPKEESKEEKLVGGLTGVIEGLEKVDDLIQEEDGTAKAEIDAPEVIDEPGESVVEKVDAALEKLEDSILEEDADQEEEEDDPLSLTGKSARKRKPAKSRGIDLGLNDEADDDLDAEEDEDEGDDLSDDEFEELMEELGIEDDDADDEDEDDALSGAGSGGGSAGGSGGRPPVPPNPDEDPDEEDEDNPDFELDEDAVEVTDPAFDAELERQRRELAAVNNLDELVSFLQNEKPGDPEDDKEKIIDEILSHVDDINDFIDRDDLLSIQGAVRTALKNIEQDIGPEDPILQAVYPLWLDKLEEVAIEALEEKHPAQIEEVDEEEEGASVATPPGSGSASAGKARKKKSPSVGKRAAKLFDPDQEVFESEDEYYEEGELEELVEEAERAADAIVEAEIHIEVARHHAKNETNKEEKKRYKAELKEWKKKRREGWKRFREAMADLPKAEQRRVWLYFKQKAAEHSEQFARTLKEEANEAEKAMWAEGDAKKKKKLVKAANAAKRKAKAREEDLKVINEGNELEKEAVDLIDEFDNLQEETEKLQEKLAEEKANPGTLTPEEVEAAHKRLKEIGETISKNADKQERNKQKKREFRNKHRGRISKLAQGALVFGVAGGFKALEVGFFFGFRFMDQLFAFAEGEGFKVKRLFTADKKKKAG